MNFSEQLKQYRKDHNLTQQQFATIVHMSRTTITELESGKKKITLKAINKIASATNTDINMWLDNVNDDTTEIKQFEGLVLIIKKLHEAGEISKNGEFSERAKEMLLEMLSIEAKCILNEKK